MPLGYSHKSGTQTSYCTSGLFLSMQQRFHGGTLADGALVDRWNLILPFAGVFHNFVFLFARTQSIPENTNTGYLTPTVPLLSLRSSPAEAQITLFEWAKVEGDGSKAIKSRLMNIIITLFCEMELKTTLKTGNTSTAEEDLLTIAQEELLFPSPLNQSQQLAGWTQPNFNLKLPATPSTQTRSRFVSLSKLQSAKSSREHSQTDETRSDLKLKLHEYLNNTNHGAEEPAMTIQIHSPKAEGAEIQAQKQDFLRGQKVKSFARKTMVMKPFYSKLSERNAERQSLTSRGTGRSVEKPQKQRKFRVTTKRGNGATIVSYPIEVEFPFDAEERRLSTRLQFYLKQRVCSH